MSAAAGRLAFAARLRAGEPLTGLVVKMPAPWLLELAGRSGFDFAIVDTEHGPAEVDALEHHLRAADCVGLPALVRVATGGRGEILHALDAGAQGVVVPHVGDAAAAEAVVRAAHYPPRGSRGLATTTRAGHHGTVSVSEHVRTADDSTLVVAQVEDANAVPRTAAIAGTPGVDVTFLGAADLAMSLGHPGDGSHPVVAAAIEHVVRGVRDAGGALCVVAGDEHEARAWRERGAQLVAFVAPVLVARCLRAVAAAVGAPRDAIVDVEG
jgi:4-hydroxy-2-oxoheptanedioate aldolase